MEPLREVNKVAMRYRDAGVDIDVAEEAVRRIRDVVSRTYGPEVLDGVGPFGSIYALGHNRYQDPVLVSTTDGVGTKLKVAFMTGRHDTVGKDLVNHCVNDVLTSGAPPLYFLDYIATSSLDAGLVERLVGSMAEACSDVGCALIGGEIAEMPGFYREGEYDLIGFLVGGCERSQLLTRSTVTAGDVLVGFASNGLHTNGYTLVRRVLFEHCKYKPDDYLEVLGRTVADELLRVHRCYAHVLLPLIERKAIKGLAHITGGGIIGNLPRVLPEGVSAHVYRERWSIPPIFTLLEREGQIPTDEMYRVFNMGLGMIAVVADTDVDGVLTSMPGQCTVVGEVVEGDRHVELA